MQPLIVSPSNSKKLILRALAPLLAFFLFHCASPPINDSSMTDQWPRFENPETDFYVNEIQPLLNKRCVVCHTCSNAPCQLHLDSYEGIRRGATALDMGSNLLYSPPTRDKDGRSTHEWRNKKFFPVLKEVNLSTNASSSEIKPPSSSSPLESSLLYQFTALGHEQNQPGFPLEPINKQADKNHVCLARPESFQSFKKNYSFAGMPYGLPGLKKDEFTKIKKWVEDGAPAPNEEFTQKSTASSIPEQLGAWEDFFNQGPKNRLMARYIFEHVFSAHIHFTDTPHHEWYELVRSRTAFPEPVDEIVTERAYDDPKTNLFYYRFKRFTRTLTRNAHIPWELNPSLLDHYQKLFIESPWNDKNAKNKSEIIHEFIKDPGYKSKNPFNYFSAIPASLRYQFLLENSQLIANAMIRGPACSGKIATHAIRDHFWVFFIKPEADVTVQIPAIGQREWTPLSELNLKDFVEPSLQYTAAMKNHRPNGFALSDLWTGDQRDPDATLTILRHETNASVHRGLIGGKPPTLWLLNYSNFERIYYNLVVDFLLWGSSAHKAATWTFMSRHRAEAEERFISFLPENFRAATRAQWTQGLGSAMNYTQAELSEGIKSQVIVKDEKNPVGALLLQLTQQYSEDQLNPDNQSPNWISTEDQKRIPPQISTLRDWEEKFLKISMKDRFPAASFFPDSVFIRLGEKAYTIINHRFYQFNNLLAMEKLAYTPEKNKLFLLKGLIGDHPDYFADLQKDQLDGFLRDLDSIKNKTQWNEFRSRYFVRRNNERVWELSDWFMDWQWSHAPLDAGVFDLRTYDIN